MTPRRVLLLTLWLGGWSLLVGVTCSPLTYMYDANGRLVAVVDSTASAPPQNVAVYNYDAAGNLLSIARRSATAASDTSIITFSPTCGPAATVVTIWGTGFTSSTQVQFNGIPAASVTFLTPIQLTATVPTGAAAGYITVTPPSPPGPLQTSASQFTTDCGGPTITNVTTASGGSCAPNGTKPVGTYGAATPVTLIGTNFDPIGANDRVTFNGYIAGVGPGSPTATSIPTTVPLLGTSGKVQVTTPRGTSVSPCDFFVPPIVSGSAYVASDVSTNDSVRMENPTGAGKSTSISMNTPNKVTLTLFDAAAGDRIGVKVNSWNLANCFCVHSLGLWGADGSGLGGYNFGATNQAGPWIEATLPRTGTSMLHFDPSGGTTGSVNVTVYKADPDIVGTLTPGVVKSMTITSSAQNARFSFPGTAGHRASAVASPDGCASSPPRGWVLTMLDVDGQTSLASTGLSSCSAGTFIETNPMSSLTNTGTYTLFFDPQLDLTGTFNISVYDVPGDVAASGQFPATVTLPINTPGQNGTVTFINPVHQSVTLHVQSVPMNRVDGSEGCAYITWFGPPVLLCKSYGFPYNFPAQTLDAGSYTVGVNPRWDATGTVSLSGP